MFYGYLFYLQNDVELTANTSTIANYRKGKFLFNQLASITSFFSPAPVVEAIADVDEEEDEEDESKKCTCGKA